MKKLVKILSVFFVFACVCVLAACSNKIDVKGYLNITPGLTSISVYAEFDANSLLEGGDAKPYVNVYDKDGEYLTKQSLEFVNSNYVKTKEVTITTSIKQGETYNVKLFVSYNSLAYELASEEVTTLAGGSSEDNPILIETKADLESMGNYPSSYFKLANNLDLDGATLSTIFTSSKKFSGSFDGNGKTISNFKLTSTTYMGIFGYVTGGTIKNLTVSNVSMSLNRNETYFGVIAGKVENGTIENCKVENCSLDFTPYSSTEGNVGLFVGIASTSKIKDCKVSASKLNVLKARYKLSAGLFAGAIDQKTKVENSHAEGSITASVYYNDSKSGAYFNVGGFVGKDQSGINSVESCTVIADIKVTEDTDKKTQADDQTVCVGGFVGTNMNGRMSIKNCAAVCDIEVENNYAPKCYVGGFVAYAGDPFDLKQVDITNCVYTAKKNGISIVYSKEINEGYKAVTDLTKWEDGVKYYTKDEEGNYILVDTTEVKTPVSKTSYYVVSKYLTAGLSKGLVQLANESTAIKGLYCYDANIVVSYMGIDESTSENVKVEDTSFLFISSALASDLSCLSEDIAAIVNNAKSAANTTVE